MASLGAALPAAVGAPVDLRWFRSSYPSLPAANVRVGFVPLLDWHMRKITSFTPASTVEWIACNNRAYCVAVACLGRNTVVPMAVVTCATCACPGPVLEC